MIINYSAAPCGSGKTKWAIERMGATAAKYVYAVDRTDEFVVRSDLIHAAAAKAELHPVVQLFASSLGDHVTRDFPTTLDRLSFHSHVVLIITHEALKMVDHSGADGWTIIIDEDPKLWASTTIDIGASVPFWQSAYSLTGLAPGFSHITRKPDGPSCADLRHDVLTRTIADIHSWIQRRPVVVSLDAVSGFDDISTRQRLTFFSIWDVRELEAYDRVYILANSFDRLISYRLISHFWPEVLMVAMEVSGSESWRPRRVRIHYVAQCHRAGSAFFQSKEGEQAVAAWAKWVKPRVRADSHYYATNKARMAVVLPGLRASPKVAGSNIYRDLTECSVLYSAKSSSQENAVFASLADGVVTPDEVMRDREYEDLIQIAFRSSLRTPNDDRPVEINVYDREQAEFLAAYFEEAGFPFETTTHFHDLGLKKACGPRGRPPAEGRRKTAAERARDYRARKKAASSSPAKPATAADQNQMPGRSQ